MLITFYYYVCKLYGISQSNGHCYCSATPFWLKNLVKKKLRNNLHHFSKRLALQSQARTVTDVKPSLTVASQLNLILF